MEELSGYDEDAADSSPSASRTIFVAPTARKNARPRSSWTSASSRLPVRCELPRGVEPGDGLVLRRPSARRRPPPRHLALEQQERAARYPARRRYDDCLLRIERTRRHGRMIRRWLVAMSAACRIARPSAETPVCSRGRRICAASSGRRGAGARVANSKRDGTRRTEDRRCPRSSMPPARRRREAPAAATDRAPLRCRRASLGASSRVVGPSAICSLTYGARCSSSPRPSGRRGSRRTRSGSTRPRSPWVGHRLSRQPSMLARPRALTVAMSPAAKASTELLIAARVISDEPGGAASIARSVNAPVSSNRPSYSRERGERVQRIGPEFVEP